MKYVKNKIRNIKIKNMCKKVFWKNKVKYKENKIE